MGFDGMLVDGFYTDFHKVLMGFLAVHAFGGARPRASDPGV